MRGEVEQRDVIWKEVGLQAGMVVVEWGFVKDTSKKRWRGGGCFVLPPLSPSPSSLPLRQPSPSCFSPPLLFLPPSHSPYPILALRHSFSTPASAGGGSQQEEGLISLFSFSLLRTQPQPQNQAHNHTVLTDWKRDVGRVPSNRPSRSPPSNPLTLSLPPS